LLDELDKTLALVGVIFSLTLIIFMRLIVGSNLYIIVGILFFIVFIGYLIMRRLFHPSSIPSLEELRCSLRFYITLNILFFLLLSYSIISIYLRPDPYIRPLGYFISTALMAAIVANDILFLSHEKSRIYFALCKIIIIGLSLQYSQILIFPSIVGIDPWYHQWFTLKILDNGHIPDGFSYSKLPLMHLMIGITSLVTDLGYKMATMLSISSLQVICDALFVFLLGGFLINTKVGLLAALLLEVSNSHIRYGFWTSPNTMGAILILPIIFILLKLRRDKPFIGTSVVMFLMGALILTHTVASIFLAIFLFVLWLSFEVYTRLFNQKNGHSLNWTICILFSILMLAYWSYISGHIITISNFIKLSFYNPFYYESYKYLPSIPFWEKLFRYIGMFLFFSLSFIGCLYMISKQFRNSNRFATTIGGIVILCIAFFSLVFEKDVLVGRWIYFSSMLMAIPLSLSLLLINVILKNRSIKGFLMSFSVFALSFIFLTSPLANMDNRIFSPNRGIRFAFTESELQAMDTISEIWSGKVGVDWYCKFPFQLIFDTKVVSIDYLLDDEDFSDLQNTLIMVREETLKHPFRISGGYITLEYDIYLALYRQNISRIYDCGSASGYLNP